ncbi:hypothetical protein CLV86_0966 [Lacinutrix venerupis]|uniref:hypothetical protein n=1 Tax=Lacinutrix venerupis TaxID=1486034 RepID=UPI000EB0847E|nr:hypothetical protein [Lacinutrix venerupis]RLJ67463.1 hypothetical protein CLV86_0966 [Lacinutrix venerupis]
MKITKLIITFIFCTLLFGCKKNTDNINSLKSIGTTTEIELNHILNTSNYKNDATKIIEAGKIKLRDLLPNVIEGQIELYKKTLTQIEYQSLLSHSYEESIVEINLIKQITTDSLLSDELRVNKIYYETINELSILNQKYADYNNLDLNDFYEAKPFILAEDVIFKIDELVIDEKQRIKREKRNNNLSLASNLFFILPGVGQISGILGKVAQNARSLRNNIGTKNMTSKIFKEKIAPLFINKISNSKKRIQLTSTALYSTKETILNKSISSGTEYIDNKEINKTASFFKSPDNEQPGRIIDFTDGILTQPIANLRRIMKENIEIMNKNSVANTVYN